MVARELKRMAANLVDIRTALGEARQPNGYKIPVGSCFVKITQRRLMSTNMTLEHTTRTAPKNGETSVAVASVTQGVLMVYLIR